MFLVNFTLFFFKFINLVRFFFNTVNFNLTFIPIYYYRSELIWSDGFLFDFLQKKSVDTWLRKFVINTGYILSERMVFDKIVRLYIDNFIYPLHNFGFLESDNVLDMLSIIIFFFFALFSFFFFFALFYIF